MQLTTIVPNASFLIITEDSPSSYSPAGERTRYMALACSSVSKSVRVLTLNRKQSESECGTGSDSSMLLYSINFGRGMPYPVSAFFDPVKLLIFFAYGLMVCRRTKISHIVASMPPFETGASACLLARLLKKELIIDLMDDWEASVEWNLRRFIPLKLLKLLFRAANRIYSCSNGILAVTLTIARTVRHRNVYVPTILAPMGTDASIFLPQDRISRRESRPKYGLPKDKTIVVYCGSGSNPYYRLDKILSAAKCIENDANSRIFFVFYLYNGVEYYQQLKGQLHIPNSLIDIRGPLPRCELSKVIGACDVGLVPFDDERYLLCARSTKLYEYLSSGLYVISSGPEGGELDSFFSENPECGVFVKPDVKNFADALSEAAKGRRDLFGDDRRVFRHLFIKRNYESQEILTKSLAHIIGFKGLPK